MSLLIKTILGDEQSQVLGVMPIFVQEAKKRPEVAKIGVDSAVVISGKSLAIFRNMGRSNVSET